MKKIFALLLAFVMVLSFASCKNGEIPEKQEEMIPMPEDTKDLAEEKDREALYDEIILSFGAKKDENGNYRAKGDFSFYRSNTSYENFHDFGMDGDVLYRIGSMLGDEKREDVMAENYPYSAFPADVFESFAYEYFGIEPEPLRDTIHYYEVEGEGWYYPFGPVYITEDPVIEIRNIEETGDTVDFYLFIKHENIEDDKYRKLTVKLLPDGGFNYISYVPYAEESEKVYYKFRLGIDGEEKEIAVGDTIGQWTLEKIRGNETEGIEAVFTGAVQADCLIYDDRMTSEEPIYFFEAINGDEDKFPVFAGDECLDITFAVKESDIKGEIPEFYGSKICFGYVIKEYHYNFLPMSVLSFAEKVEVYERFAAIETKEPELIEKHILALNEVEDDNFGAETKDEYLAMLYKTDPGPGAFDKQPDAIVTGEEAKSEEYSGWFENQMIEECREITNFKTEDEIKEYLGEYLAPELFDTDALKIHIIEFGGKAYRVWYSRGYGVKSYGNSEIISQTENEMTAKAYIYHVGCEEAGTADMKFEKQGENWILVSVKDSYYRDES